MYVLAARNYFKFKIIRIYCNTVASSEKRISACEQGGVRGGRRYLSGFHHFSHTKTVFLWCNRSDWIVLTTLKVLTSTFIDVNQFRSVSNNKNTLLYVKIVEKLNVNFCLI